MQPLTLARLALRASALSVMITVPVELSYADAYRHELLAPAAWAFFLRLAMRLLAMVLLFGLTDRIIAIFTRRPVETLEQLSSTEVGVVILRLAACWIIVWGLNDVTFLPGIFRAYHTRFVDYAFYAAQLRPAFFILAGAVVLAKTGRIMWLLSPSECSTSS